MEEKDKQQKESWERWGVGRVNKVRLRGVKVKKRRKKGEYGLRWSKMKLKCGGGGWGWILKLWRDEIQGLKVKKSLDSL